MWSSLASPLSFSPSPHTHIHKHTYKCINPSHPSLSCMLRAVECAGSMWALHPLWQSDIWPSPGPDHRHCQGPPRRLPAGTHTQIPLNKFSLTNYVHCKMHTTCQYLPLCLRSSQYIHKQTCTRHTRSHSPHVIGCCAFVSPLSPFFSPPQLGPFVDSKHEQIEVGPHPQITNVYLFDDRSYVLHMYHKVGSINVKPALCKKCSWKNITSSAI